MRKHVRRIAVWVAAAGILVGTGAPVFAQTDRQLEKTEGSDRYYDPVGNGLRWWEDDWYWKNRSTAPIPLELPVSSGDAEELAKQALRNTVTRDGRRVGVATVTNEYSLTAAAIRSLARAGEDAGIPILLQSEQVKDKKILSRVTIDTSQYQGQVDLSVERNKNSLLTYFRKFGNDIAAISFAEANFHEPVKVAVWLENLNKFRSTDNLCFYSYNERKNTYTKLEQDYFIDSAGYLCFTTQTGGDLILSDGPLAE